MATTAVLNLPDSGPTLVLNMIVKNESKIITRLIDSVASVIDSYAICDTGSTDGTPKIIQDHFKNKYPHIKGTVFTHAWKNFGHNRTKALKSAKGLGDYALLVDADMIVNITNEFDKKTLNQKTHWVKQMDGELVYYIPRIVRTDADLKYVCYTHEYLDSNTDAATAPHAKGIWITHVGDGGAKADKFERDLVLLEKQRKDNICPSRTEFYLGQTYLCKGDYKKAIEAYHKRIEHGGWDEEIWYSWYQIGNCYRNLKDMPNAINAWLTAYQVIPQRSENIYQICKHYQETSQYHLAYQMYLWGKQIAYPVIHTLFIESDIYNWGFDWLYSIMAAYANPGDQDVPIVFKRLLGSKCPYQDTIKSNFQYYRHSCALQTAVGCQITAVSFDDTFCQDIQNIECIPMSHSTPSIVNLKNGNYGVNVRLHNYSVSDKCEYTIHDKNQQITTINKYIELDGTDLNKRVKEHMFEEAPTDLKYKGIEDLRLFQRESDSVIVYAGNTNMHGHMRVSTGIYDPSKSTLSRIESPSPSVPPRDCEKNWVFVGDATNRMIRDWRNSQGVMDIGVVDEKTGIFETTSNPSVPSLFQHFRGSTNGCLFGKDLFYVVHIVSHEKSLRKYYHMMVTLDHKTLEVKQTSNLFTFENCDIEYCLGLVVEYDRVSMTYSTWDKTSHLAVYDKNNLFAQICLQ